MGEHSDPRRRVSDQFQALRRLELQQLKTAPFPSALHKEEAIAFSDEVELKGHTLRLPGASTLHAVSEIADAARLLGRPPAGPVIEVPQPPA